MPRNEEVRQKASTYVVRSSELSIQPLERGRVIELPSFPPGDVHTDAPTFSNV